MSVNSLDDGGGHWPDNGLTSTGSDGPEATTDGTDAHPKQALVPFREMARLYRRYYLSTNSQPSPKGTEAEVESTTTDMDRRNNGTTDKARGQRKARVPRRLYLCSTGHCQRTIFGSLKDIQRHLRDKHIPAGQHVLRELKRPRQRQFQCVTNGCGHVTHALEHMQSHVRSNHFHCVTV